MLNMGTKLKIQYFGAIKRGYLKDDGYMTMNKVTVLTGPQASGKSTVAKLFSLFAWLEKALVRGNVTEEYVTGRGRFAKQYCDYHGLSNYFNDDTYIDYCGVGYRMTYSEGKFTVVEQSSKSEYRRPKVMYVPAERNLISILDNAENVKNLPESLATFLARYIAACKRSSFMVQLPLKNLTFRYDQLNKIALVSDGEKSLHLSETASGIQSLTPLYIVLDDLARHLEESSSSRSIKEQDTINKRVEELLKDPSISSDALMALVNQVTDVTNKYLVSIVEEPEQNLFPSSQREILNSLLAINSASDNQMLITTHSPFIINNLALAIKAADIFDKVYPENIDRLDKIVPTPAVVDGKNVNVYELDGNGEIHDVNIVDGVLSDNNVLNVYLQENNDMFNELLDIEEGEQ